MPLVSQMLIRTRGTRGAPRNPRGSGALRAASTGAIDHTLRRVFADLSVARPELGLPFRRSELADVLLDPRADFRGDFPPISPRAAIALLCELALLDRRRDQRARGLDAHLARIGQRVHLAMARYLYAHREQASGPVLVEPTIDPGRWVSFDLRLGPLVVVLCDALRSTLLLDLERRLRDPIEVRRTQHPRQAVTVDVLGCLRYRHEIWRKQLRAQCLRASGHYFEYPGAVYQPLAPLRTWHWLDGFLNRHRAMLDAVVRAATDEPDVAADWSPRLEAWLRGNLRAALRRSGAMQGLRRAVRASLPYSDGQLESALRLRRDPNAQLRAMDVAESLCNEPAYGTLRRESPTLLHLCATVAFANCYIRPFEPQRLKGRLHEMGLSPAGWRLLCRHGTRAYAAQLKGTDSYTEAVAAAVSTLNLIASCQRRGLPPRELMRQLAEIEDQNLTEEPLAPMPLLRAAWDHALALPTRHARRAFARDAFARAVTWWRRRYEPSGIPAGSPWAWFEGQTRAWEVRERAMCAACATEWTTPVPEFQHEGVLVVPLGSATALWDEGLALRHCTGNDLHATACLRGTERIYSLRDAATGRRLATAALVRKPGKAWRLGQVSGFANRPVTRADVLAASSELLRAFNAPRADSCNDESATNGDAIGAA